MNRQLSILYLIPLVLSSCSGPASAPTPLAGEQQSRKEEYSREIRAKLDQVADELADLRVRAEATGAEARAQLEPQLERLREQARSLEGRLERLKGDTAAAWEAARPELDRALQHLRDASRKAASAFDR